MEHGPDVSEDELATFAATNMVNDWLTPADNCKACEQAGWKQVTFVDLTSDIRLSFQLMKKKVDQIIARGGDGIDMDLLTEYSKNLGKASYASGSWCLQVGCHSCQKRVNIACFEFVYSQVWMEM